MEHYFRQILTTPPLKNVYDIKRQEKVKILIYLITDMRLHVLSRDTALKNDVLCIRQIKWLIIYYFCGIEHGTTSSTRMALTFMHFLLNIPYGYRSPLHSIT